MNQFDRALRKGSPFRLGLGIVLTGFFAVMAVVQPERRYAALFFVLLGLSWTWIQYRAYSAKKKA